MSLSQCTGYTSGVVDGKVTDAKDFLSMCLHAFGVMTQYRHCPSEIHASGLGSSGLFPFGNW